MEFLLALILITIGLGLVAMVLLQARSGSVPILSTRNFFYFGLAIFQISSAAIAFITQDYWETAVTDPVGTGSIFTGSLILFLIIFETVYRTGWFTFGMTGRLMTRFRIPSDTTILGLSTAMITLALVCKFILIEIPVIGVLAGLVGTAFAAAAAGLFCWIWARQITNPIYLSFGIFILSAAFVVSTYKAFGRRDLLSVMSACLWGAYHGYYKYLPIRRAFVPLATVASVGVVAVALFTAARGHDNNQLSQSELNSRMANASFKDGFMDLLTGQYCAPCSFWLIESRPDSYPYDTLHSFHYAVTNIIPRAYYPSILGNKPTGLGLTMVPQAALDEGRSGGFSVGPGLIGHIFNDNPWIALPFYAIFIGAVLHIFDRLLQYQGDNVFIVIPIGGAIGELIAIARGELGLYLFRTLASTLFVSLAMVVLAKIIMGASWKYVPAEAEAEDEAEAVGEDVATGPALKYIPAKDEPEDGTPPAYGDAA